MKKSENDQQLDLLRYRDDDLTETEQAILDKLVIDNPQAGDLLDTYQQLEQTVETLPRFQPTRDLVGAAITEANKRSKPPNYPSALAALAGALLLLAVIILPYYSKPSTSKKPAEATASIARPRASFYHTGSSDSTFARIRDTRERLRQRKLIFNKVTLNPNLETKS